MQRRRVLAALVSGVDDIAKHVFIGSSHDGHTLVLAMRAFSPTDARVQP